MPFGSLVGVVEPFVGFGCVGWWIFSGYCGHLSVSGGCLFLVSSAGSFVFGGVVSCVGCPAALVVGLLIDIYGEFDSGSGRTLAACLTHASRTVISGLALVDQWRTGE